jgi:hypothetical protein
VSAIAQTEAPPATRAGALRALAARPWACALALALPLSAIYLAWSPPAADLAAAIYRSDLFARAGFVLRDSGWYAGHSHYVIGYSLLSPPLGALLGVRLSMALSVLAASVLFGLVAQRVFPLPAARAAALVFAFGLCAELLSGRVPYDLGVAIGLGAVLALQCGRRAWALALALLCSLASPVAGAFLALALLAWAIAVLAGPAPADGDIGESPGHGRAVPDLRSRGGIAHGGIAHGGVARAGRAALWPLALTTAALAPIVALAVAFPEGGHEPFAPSSFWPAFVAVLLFAALLPRGPLSPRAHRGLRTGAALYALALAASFAIATPMGGNAARLGPELAPALLVGVLWERRRLALALLAPAILYWQLNTPVGDYSLIAGQASANASYYTPLVAELGGLSHDRPTIVEIPLTATHMEAAYVAGHDGVELARGWDRQLDTRYAALFYGPGPTPAAYGSWLRENRVAYVALPDAEPDYSARGEVALIRGGLPYLREIWHAPRWRLFRVIG